MKKLLMLAALAAVVAGCGVKKVNYERKADGTVSYRIYENEHWLNTEATGLRGGMTPDGAFSYAADGVKTSPSEEFNRSMQTYTATLVQLMQIAAAAYNPSASAAAAKSESSKAGSSTIILEAPKAETQPDQVEAPGACTDGSCEVK